MQEGVTEFPIVGEEQKACRVLIEAANGEKPWIGLDGNEVGDSALALIVHGRQVPSRLVQHDDDALGNNHLARPIKPHLVARRVNLHTHLGHDRTVDAHPPC